MNPNHPKNIDWNVILLGEMLLLGVLSKSIQTVPDREWINSLLEQDVFSESPLEASNPEVEQGLALLQSWSQANKGGISDEEFGNLQTDYTRLFIGPGKPIAPPWESVYFNEDHMIFQEQTVQVRAWYRRFGLEPEKLYQEPDDHIGLELSFLSHLAGLALQSLESNDNARFVEILEAQSQFISQHPLKWVKAWDAQIEKYARSDFYRGLGRLIHGAVLTLAQILQADTPRKVAL